MEIDRHQSVIQSNAVKFPRAFAFILTELMQTFLQQNTSTREYWQNSFETRYASIYVYSCSAWKSIKWILLNVKNYDKTISFYENFWNDANCKWNGTFCASCWIKISFCSFRSYMWLNVLFGQGTIYLCIQKLLAEG